jgi:carboxyl-terminal processing protease
LRREIAGKLKGYHIDLRNNTGGLLDRAVRSADVFLDGGLIVELRGREPQSDRRNALLGDAASGLPLVVLVNGGTAAGAEIMASALQDHKRARLVGSRTAGSATVQTIFLFGRPLVNGQSYGAIKLTTHHHYTPLGRAVEGVGVEPDVAVARAGNEGPAGFVPPDKSRDAQLQRALSLLRDGI